MGARAIADISFNNKILSFPLNQKFVEGNKKFDADRNFLRRGCNELTDFSGTQLGIYRHSSLGQNMADFLKDTGLVLAKWTEPVASFFKVGVTGTTFWHALDTTRSVVEVAEDAARLPSDKRKPFLEIVKKVADVVSSWLFVAVTFFVKSSLVLTVAKLIACAGDSAELSVELDKKAQFDADVAQVQVVAESEADTAVKQAQFHQMLGIAKIVISVVAGVLLVLQCLPVLIAWASPQLAALLAGYVPTVVGSILSAKVLAVVNAVLSLAGSLIPVVAHYYKQLSMKYHPEIKAAQIKAAQQLG